MSYILEALRKSERDRQAAQTPTLPHLLNQPPPRRPHWMGWLLAGLLVVNGLGLAWLAFHGRSQPDAPVALPPARSASPAMPKASADAAPKAVVSLDPPPAPAVPPAPATAPKPAHPSAEAKAPAKPAAHVAKPHTAKPAKPAPPAEEATPDPALAEDGEEAPPPPILAGLKPRPALRPPPPRPALEDRGDEADAPASQAERPAHDPVPWLSALPGGFRQRLPQFKINIFAYSSLPEERFAIIDMRKYRVGDRIPGDALLLDIRADCLVLEWEGQKFRFPRP